jgi:hypothetical protein
MEPQQRKIVMEQIILKSGRQSAGARQFGETKDVSSPSPLTTYFSNLPLGTQINALQDGYKSVSTQFKQLAGSVENPLVQIVKPKTIDEEISERFPSLTSVKEGGNNDDTANNNTANDTTTNNNINNNDTANANSSNKTVVFKI